MQVRVIKKNGSTQKWMKSKIKKAIQKSYERAKTKERNIGMIFGEEEKDKVVEIVESKVKGREEITVAELHELVMEALFDVNKEVYTEYRAYRDYKKRFAESFANTYELANKVLNVGDTENANKDSTLNSTKQMLISEGIMRELMRNFELKPQWVEAHDEGWIYIHDLSSRFLNSHNCCLFDMGNLLKDGFDLNGVKYKEPSGIQSAFNVAGDVVLSSSSNQYGGYTVSNVDKVFEPYCLKSYEKAKRYFIENGIEIEKARQLAHRQTLREIEQGYQAFETKLNSISNALGQTPFITISFGLETGYWAREIMKTILKVRMDGLGATHVTSVFPY